MTTSWRSSATVTAWPARSGRSTCGSCAPTDLRSGSTSRPTPSRPRTASSRARWRSSPTSASARRRSRSCGPRKALPRARREPAARHLPLRPRDLAGVLHQSPVHRADRARPAVAPQARQPRALPLARPPGRPAGRGRDVGFVDRVRRRGGVSLRASHRPPQRRRSLGRLERDQGRNARRTAAHPGIPRRRHGAQGGGGGARARRGAVPRPDREPAARDVPERLPDE